MWRACTPHRDGVSDYGRHGAGARVHHGAGAAGVGARRRGHPAGSPHRLHYFPAADVLWLLAACDGAPSIHFWLIYVVLWPAFAIGAAVSLRWTVESYEH